MQMTLRYAHVSCEHKQKAVNLLNGLTAPEIVTKEELEKNGHKMVTTSTPTLSNYGRGERI